MSEEGPTYEERAANINEIAQPLAGKKMTKKLHKLVKKAAKGKALRRGVKEVVKALRKNERGLCVIAGDISPIDVISHLPILCEEADVPYIYVPSKADLGAAAQTKRPTSCALIAPKTPFTGETLELYDQMVQEVVANAPTF